MSDVPEGAPVFLDVEILCSSDELTMGVAEGRLDKSAVTATLRRIAAGEG